MKVQRQQFKPQQQNAFAAKPAQTSSPFFGGASTAAKPSPSTNAFGGTTQVSQFKSPVNFAGSGNNQPNATTGNLLRPDMSGGASAKIPGGFGQANHLAFA